MKDMALQQAQPMVGDQGGAICLFDQWKTGGMFKETCSKTIFVFSVLFGWYKWYKTGILHLLMSTWNKLNLQCTLFQRNVFVIYHYNWKKCFPFQLTSPSPHIFQPLNYLSYRDQWLKLRHFFPHWISLFTWKLPRQGLYSHCTSISIFFSIRFLH